MPIMNERLVNEVDDSLRWFIKWLDTHGETSYDFHTFYASPVGGKAKSLYYTSPILGVFAVAPMVLCEAFFPSARGLFWKKQRFPIADAHYAMGFALLFRITQKSEYYQKALHFLDVLEQTRCPGYQYFCWGYPYDWQTKEGRIEEGTPLITSTPYAYEAFKEVYGIDKEQKWLDIMHSIANHAQADIKDYETSPNASACSYTPHNSGGVINASAYRAFLLTSASIDFGADEYRQTAERNLNFVLESQQPNGSWYYTNDDKGAFVDHFHTCFVLKSLAKIEQLTGNSHCYSAIQRGMGYYLTHLFDERGLPKPFSVSPRLTVYKRELYNYAECINLLSILKNRFPEFNNTLSVVLQDLLSRWQKPDGSFRSRQLLLGWDNVPMHRWAQSQLFRSLCYFLSTSQSLP